MPSILTELDSCQQEAVKKTDGPILVLAGAGSGKTRVLTYKVAYLIQEQKVKPENILMVTFTNKAADEMKGRVWQLLGQKTNLPLMGTFHSFCAKILRVEGEKIGIAKNYSIFDESDSQELTKEAMEELLISAKNFRPQAIRTAISQAKNELLTPSGYQEIAYGYFGQTVAKIYPQYQKLLGKNNALDFDDLLFETVTHKPA